jgi:hypothetical protein
MRELRFTSSTFIPAGTDSTVPDAYIDPTDLKNARRESVGLPVEPRVTTPTLQNLPNHGKYQQENNIKPGTEEWFKLWFGRK